MPTGAELIAAERARQVTEEGWTPEHDDKHTDGSLALAAVCYASPVLLYRHRILANCEVFEEPWPWSSDWDKRKHDGNVVVQNNHLGRTARIRQLVKAGALIAAEIDRLQRAGRKAKP